MLRFVGVAVSNGIKKVRVTGGEPFVRRGVVDFLGKIAAIPGLSGVSVTTNASLIGEYIDSLKTIGLSSMNISLDTLDRKRFHSLTGSDSFPEVFDNIKRLIKMDFIKLKINMVVMGGVNDDEVVDMAALAKDNDVEVRFIENMSYFAASDRPGKLVSAETVRGKLEKLGELTRVADAEAARAAKVYRIQGFKGRIGVISPVTEPFCHTCNRIRLTADGKLKACLVDNSEVDVSRALRKDDSDEKIGHIIQSVIRSKPHKHEPSAGDAGGKVARTMCEIGG